MWARRKTIWRRIGLGPQRSAGGGCEQAGMPSTPRGPYLPVDHCFVTPHPFAKTASLGD